MFGRGFVLLRLGPSPPDPAPLAAAAAAKGMPIEAVDIARPDIAALYGRALVLVRPDGHVAWRGDELPADPAAAIDCVRGVA